MFPGPQYSHGCCNSRVDSQTARNMLPGRGGLRPTVNKLQGTLMIPEITLHLLDSAQGHPFRVGCSRTATLSYWAVLQNATWCWPIHMYCAACLPEIQKRRVAVVSMSVATVDFRRPTVGRIAAARTARCFDSASTDATCGLARRKASRPTAPRYRSTRSLSPSCNSIAKRCITRSHKSSRDNTFNS